MAEQPQGAVVSAKNSVLVRMAERFGVDANKLYASIKETAFRGDISNEQFLALMIVADQYGLNPLTKELYAFPDKNNGIVPVVGVDGWARIINEHPQNDGLEFLEGPTDKNGIPEWIEAVFFRKDRQHPTRVREYFVECKRNTPAWSSHPRRMLRHKATIQGARLAFGLVGIYDPDEAERIVDGASHTVVEPEAVRTINAEIKTGRVIASTDDPPGRNGGTPPDELEASARPLSAYGLAPTYAQVREALEHSKAGSDARLLARDMIRGVADPKQRAELTAIADHLDERPA